MQAEVQKPSVPVEEHEAVRSERMDLERQLRQAQERIRNLELEIATLHSQIRSIEAPESMVQSLRSEIAMLREQLSRATAENERNGTTVPLGPRHQHHRSMASDVPAADVLEFHEDVLDERRGADVPPEEIIDLLEDEAQLDEDVLHGLIEYLKIPLPSLQNPPGPKEVLFLSLIHI